MQCRTVSLAGGKVRRPAIEFIVGFPRDDSASIVGVGDGKHAENSISREEREIHEVNFMALARGRFNIGRS
jgi:hypothetical protein